MFLIQLNVSMFGKIAMVRYGGTFRGDKALLAERHGAVGVIIYSDPFDYAPESHTHNRVGRALYKPEVYWPVFRHSPRMSGFLRVRPSEALFYEPLAIRKRHTSHQSPMFTAH